MKPARASPGVGGTSIPLIVANAAAALRGPLRRFLENPDPVGSWVHVRDLGVDVTLHVVHERPGAYTWRCACGREAVRSGPLTQPWERFACGLCGATAPDKPAFRGDAAFRTYAWTVRWSRPGREGWALGPLVDEGRFNDHQLLLGLGRMHAVLTHELGELERAGVTSMEDFRTLQRLEVAEKGAST